MNREMEELAVALYDIDAVKFGEFVTKTGLKTPIYFDIRVVISHPKIMVRLAKALWKFADDSTGISQICGVPYTALPLATIISVDTNLPMLIKRKEVKEYGTKKNIEGKFTPGEHCVIIEDVVTSGSSVLETANALTKEGLKVSTAFVIIDREQGGKKNLEDHGIKMRSLFTITDLMQYLLKGGKITADTVKAVMHYIQSSAAPVKLADESTQRRLSLSFNDRAKEAKNDIASQLFQLMEAKRSNLCLAVDLTKTEPILKHADICGPHIAVLKIHADIIEDFNENFIKELRVLAKKHKFMIMEDRKFADIGNTVALQYQKGFYKIAQWAELITVHPVPGSTVIDGLKSALNGTTEPRGIFLVAEMSSKNALTTGDYARNALSIARNAADCVVGLVCQSNIFSDAGLIQLTPGVRLSEKHDALGQQYNTPESVVNAGADLAVIGRGIIESQDILKTTVEYKEELWSAYEKRVRAI